MSGSCKLSYREHDYIIAVGQISPHSGRILRRGKIVSRVCDVDVTSSVH